MTDTRRILDVLESRGTPLSRRDLLRLAGEGLGDGVGLVDVGTDGEHENSLCAPADRSPSSQPVDGFFGCRKARLVFTPVARPLPGPATTR